MASHISSFATNEIDGMCLVAGLDDATLIGLGVLLPVHRRKFQALLAALLGSDRLAPLFQLSRTFIILLSSTVVY
jgi:hypothetical protein